VNNQNQARLLYLLVVVALVLGIADAIVLFLHIEQVFQ
jgi:hypothetical protein